VTSKDPIKLSLVVLCCRAEAGAERT
jgi:hypothetical protein